MIDLDALAAVSCPVLLTQGDQSPPFFAAIISRLAEAIDRAQVTTIRTPAVYHIRRIPPNGSRSSLSSPAGGLSESRLESGNPLVATFHDHPRTC
jgi:hypothetical protein